MKIYITKTAEDSAWLAEYCKEQKWKLTAESMIEFSEMKFEVPEKTDILFFSSKNGVRYFFNQNELPKGAETACVGKETARVLRKHNIEPAFIGQNSGDPESVGKEFLNFIGDKHVFFPTSNASLHTIANLIPDTQKDIASIYETKTKSTKIEKSDVYIFSSPSNVKGFLEKNKVAENAKVIAWGVVTANALMDNDVFPEFILETGQKEELLEYLATL
jgi:uroporphyrinogen-III synthase